MLYIMQLILVMKILLNFFFPMINCDPNFRDRDQMTPLHLAVKRNSPHIVQLLLSDQLINKLIQILVNQKWTNTITYGS